MLNHTLITKSWISAFKTIHMREESRSTRKNKTKIPKFTFIEQASQGLIRGYFLHVCNHFFSISFASHKTTTSTKNINKKQHTTNQNIFLWINTFNTCCWLTKWVDGILRYLVSCNTIISTISQQCNSNSLRSRDLIQLDTWWIATSHRDRALTVDIACLSCMKRNRLLTDKVDENWVSSTSSSAHLNVLNFLRSNLMSDWASYWINIDTEHNRFCLTLHVRHRIARSSRRL